MKNVFPLVAVLAVGLAACGAEPAEEAADAPAPEAEPAPPAMTVTIESPSDGESIMGTAVTVTLTVSGVQIVPAGELVEGTGHHHLYLDADLGDPTVPIPTIPGSVVHMGDGSGEYTFEGVTPGEHRIIAVVADGVHVPLQPWVVDTVTFVVNE